jgi:hypothetical protein
MSTFVDGSLNGDLVDTFEKISEVINTVEVVRQFFIAEDRKDSDAWGGGSTANTYVTRDLNLVTFNTITGASLSSDQVTLPAGTYLVVASSPTYNVRENAIKLRNITDSSDEVIGAGAGSRLGSVRAYLDGLITISAEKVFEVQHRCSNSQSTYGFGVYAFNINSVYTKIRIEKIG